MAKQGFKEAGRRYHRRFWPAMAVYVAAILGGSYWLDTFETPPVWLAAGVACAAAVPLAYVLFAMLRHIEETDEFTRLRQLRAFAQGAVVTVSAIFVIGLLQVFEVLPTVTVFWFGPFFFFAYGLAFCGARLLNRAA